MAINKNKLEELLAFEGHIFIEEAYRSVLLREADQNGLRNGVSALEHGMSKEQFLFDLRFSEEGLIRRVEFKDFNIREIEISRLLSFNKEPFIEAAYIAVLGRMPDDGGKKFYLKSIDSGAMSKADVLLILRYSEEGKKLGVNIKGLKFVCAKQKIKGLILHVPFIGRVIRYLWNLAHINRTVNERMSRVNSYFADINHRLGEYEQCTGNMKQEIYNIELRLDGIQCQIDKLVLENIKRQNVSRLTTGGAYKNYEDKMRGSREEIINRLDIYEMIVNKVKANNGERIFALDLGCGRGEWLELMNKKYLITALGVDSDESMLSDCKKNDLLVVNADILDYIKNAESNSVDIVTMIQVAEHLPVGVLVDVMNECFRVLRKGGAIIVETPNPENLIIGSCNFYLDPTHITKLPPELLKIYVEAAGMSDVEVVRMHQYNAIDVTELNQSNAEGSAIRQMANFFNNYADYAVVAFKK